MNIQSAKIVLSKINLLFNTMQLDETNISSIERDLMLSYVRQLYDAFLIDAPPPAMPQLRTEMIPMTPKTEKISPPVVIPVPSVEKNVVELEIPSKIVEKTAESPASVPVAAEKPAPMILEKPKPVAPLQQNNEHTVVVPAPILAATNQGKPIIQPPPTKVEERQLFEQRESQELAERLVESPIRDIKTAMGLNERMLTVKELFDGDSYAFEDALTRLNNFSNFEQAKEYMLQTIAPRYDWGTSEKVAKAFIKLVRRRYL